jgi:hypothetical protein
LIGVQTHDLQHLIGVQTHDLQHLIGVQTHDLQHLMYCVDIALTGTEGVTSITMQVRMGAALLAQNYNI